jgi:hypothetical protein
MLVMAVMSMMDLLVFIISGLNVCGVSDVHDGDVKGGLDDGDVLDVHEDFNDYDFLDVRGAFNSKETRLSVMTC